jgi:hypothetical protein
MTKHWTDKLVAMKACPDAVEWARAHPSLAAAWKACERADWMLWLAGELCRTVPQRKRLTLATCACARTALKYVPKGEKRPLVAIQTAERWARGTHGVTIEDVRAAWAAAGDAARAAGEAAWAAGDTAWAAWAAAGDAAWAAGDAAWAAWAAGDTAWAAWAAAGDAAWAAGEAARAAGDAARAAAWAARTATWAAARAAGEVARIKALADMSNIVRKHYPAPPRLRGEEK